MLASISPVGEASRGQRWPVTATAYFVGSLLGGTVVGVVAGAIGRGLAAVSGPWPADVTVLTLAVLGALAVAIDRGVLPVRLPSWPRQVDETWLTRYRGWVYGAGFGFQLGAGVLTRVPTAATHLALITAVAAAATATTTGAVVIGATFGLVRAAPMLWAGALTDPVRLTAFHRRLQAAARPADLVSSGAVAVIAVLATTAVLVG